MKLLIIGDPHLKITQFNLSKQFLQHVDETIIKYKPDLIVNLGDTFDSHAVVRSEIMSEFMAHVDRSLKVAPYVYVVGNHDMFKPNDSKYHALAHLVDKIPNFTVVDKVQDIYDMTFVPYTHNPDDFPLTTLPICVAHQTFKGCDLGNITTQNGVDPEMVSAEIIISGHIHKRQNLGKVIYPGSPFAQNANDLNQVKGLMLFDTDTYKYMYVPSPLPMWKSIAFEVVGDNDTGALHDKLTQELNNKDHWLIEIAGNKAEIVAYLGSKQYSNLIAGKNIKIKTSYKDSEKKLAKIEAVSMESIIAEYIDKIYSGSLDKSLLKNKALSVLGQNSDSNHKVDVDLV